MTGVYTFGNNITPRGTFVTYTELEINLRKTLLHQRRYQMC